MPIPFPLQTMFAPIITIITGKNNHRIFLNPHFFQFSPQPPDCLINTCYQPIISLYGRLVFFICSIPILKTHMPFVLPLTIISERFGKLLIIILTKSFRLAKMFIFIHGTVLLVKRKRILLRFRMRTFKAHRQTKRFCFISIIQKFLYLFSYHPCQMSGIAILVFLVICPLSC